ncbi:hypothetical protein [Streptomyces sp. VNUA24]|uniref:hypothetical protein n=1 Tax=Streptomyces sp. VNUA24 TaxID=3031131 RepID=UPI0023B85EE1|nr:hypothetical protein [Streptomyces sp. VNUA24]WEH13046.1 hypothetical protein PYR72_04735 [Streptomyces sp. VNUA24]
MWPPTGAKGNLVRLDEQYRLWPAGDGEPIAVRYLAPDTRVTVVIVLGRARRFGQHDRPLRLRSLDPAARYRDVATGPSSTGLSCSARGYRGIWPWTTMLRTRPSGA